MHNGAYKLIRASITQRKQSICIAWYNGIHTYTYAYKHTYILIYTYIDIYLANLHELHFGKGQTLRTNEICTVGMRQRRPNKQTRSHTHTHAHTQIHIHTHIYTFIHLYVCECVYSMAQWGFLTFATITVGLCCAALLGRGACCLSIWSQCPPRLQSKVQRSFAINFNQISTKFQPNLYYRPLNSAYECALEEVKQSNNIACSTLNNGTGTQNLKLRRNFVRFTNTLACAHIHTHIYLHWNYLTCQPQTSFDTRLACSAAQSAFSLRFYLAVISLFHSFCFVFTHFLFCG